MMLTAVAIFDEVAGFFQTPMFFNNSKEAIRYFEFLCSSPETSVGRFPQHHHLYFVGDFDSNLGVIDCDEKPRLIVSGVALVGEKS